MSLWRGATFLLKPLQSPFLISCHMYSIALSSPPLRFLPSLVILVLNQGLTTEPRLAVDIHQYSNSGSMRAGLQASTTTPGLDILLPFICRLGTMNVGGIKMELLMLNSNKM